ncbi:MAG: hypothetical protein IJB59_00435 [Oscillospiraceae bacterium]|nr:hypothetical protein [Oscillospiraceae bacterium]
MKKRIVCVLLTLIMLMSLLPVSASAASRSVSENAITILKQLEGYTTACAGKGSTFGYGTICTKKEAHTYHSEKEADAALREALKDLDKAVNSFSSSKGAALTQGQHDALVLFSFENGTAWTTGTGDLQAAVVNKLTGSDFLNAICRWDASVNDDSRRMIEANMYLNGVYNSTRPSNYIRVRYDANGGSLNGSSEYQYYDVASKPAPHLVPFMDHYNTFTGWYITDPNSYAHNVQVTKLTADFHNTTLTAHWAYIYGEPGDVTEGYSIPKAEIASQIVYKYNSTKQEFEKISSTTANDLLFEGILYADSVHIGEDGIKWARAQGTDYWVKVKGTGSKATADADANIAYIDVTVTVTNSRVNMRVNASTSSRQNGSYKKGDKVRIINTANGSGLLWGQVAASATDNTPIGWIALMYTNFESVRDSQEATTPVNNSIAIAKATITYNGYVNVRSDAGMDNKIVSALPFGTEVDIYETKFVNGQEWGRCNAGWFSLKYASVERLKTDNSYKTDVGFTSYVFTGTLEHQQLYVAPGGDPINSWLRIDPNVTVTNLVEKDGITWGKIPEGWVKVSYDDGSVADVRLDSAKYLVSAESLTVREAPNTAAPRVNTVSLVKNVEFFVNVHKQVVVSGDSIWGYATKAGEDAGTSSYYGWVNLANKYVTRNGIPAVDGGNDAASSTAMMATVVGTNSVKVRITGATYGKQIGTLSMGTTAAIIEEKDGWYNLDIDVDGNPETGSWVSGKYLDIHQGTTGGTSSDNVANGGSTSSNGAVETGLGIVANTYAGVNVRTGAGTGYASNGKLLPGTTVEIMEVVTKGASKWGRTAQGWVCMDYITMISTYPVAGSTASGNTSGTTGSTSTGSTVTSSEPAIYTGTANGTVEVYKTTSRNSEVVRTLSDGSPVTMHEILTVSEDVTTNTSTDNGGSVTTTQKVTSYWARVNDGYIYAPGENINLDTVDEHTYTMTGSNSLNVRNNPGTSGTSVLFKLEKGDQVKVTQLKIVNSGIWGFIECDKGTGWASLSYMTKGAVTIQPETPAPETTPVVPNTPALGNGSNVGGFVTNTSGYRYTGKVIRANEVNVRATPSTSASKTTTLSNGQALVIYETTTAENMAWGRCDAGWVYLYYVDLTPVVNGAVDARVVYNENTIIYTDVNGSGVAGTYARMSVIDIYEIVGKMARTELGWVNTDNLL